MTKLCNSCEYLKFCARSGIEDIGCDRYKRDATTNEEWFCSLSTEEKAMVIVLCCPYEADWFGENFEKRMEQRMKNLSQSAQGYELGVQKIKEWLKQPHTDKE